MLGRGGGVGADGDAEWVEVFAEKGARFRGKWGLGPPPPGPSPRPPGGFTENPGGGGSSRRRGGEGCVQGIWGGGGGGAEAPITVKMRPLFGENALHAQAPI